MAELNAEALDLLRSAREALRPQTGDDLVETGAKILNRVPEPPGKVVARSTRHDSKGDAGFSHQVHSHADHAVSPDYEKRVTLAQGGRKSGSSV